MRRFWERAEAVPREGGWGVALDGRALRLPSGTTLSVPTRALAEAIAEEWQAAGGAKGAEVRLAALGVTRVIATAIDRVAPDPEATVAALAKYGAADLLCYRAEFPPELAARQAERWQPLLDWAALALDAPLVVTAGVVPVAQPPAALAALRGALARRSPVALAALGVAVPALGSLVLGLALADGRIGPEEAHALATLDEAFQAEEWGEDAEAAARLAAIAADVRLAARILALDQPERVA
ncbi:ATP12 family chaperone protein [Elioraea sp.]|jgi:chaperone required for assembly of F1-ATPase|uniref:ATP12 family chaperone protein n=1 Tax=Elioraea sp. TaxID=2185103 RepID=UPI0021DD4FFE|nr:ATP12 family protein [Elioraea sp.]GIX10297.1 MAG: ATPase [Elioraea sp.]